ncbi:MAG: transcription antitermination factor NusB [Phycisphaerales bacterium]|nr:transcription antitermination factor NusB [Phycisphaerales bacterium]
MTYQYRTQARKLALQALCAYEAVGDGFREQLGRFLSDDEILSDIGIASPPEAEIVRFAHRLTQGAWSRRGELDRRIEGSAAHWSLARMTPVDRNILRLGLFELLEPVVDAPPAAIISEALELARVFGDTDSPAFVNGVLDAARRQIDHERASPAT